MVKTLVIGLGNPILGDDGAGWRVAEEVRKQLPASLQAEGPRRGVEIDFHSGGGLGLMERLVGYDRAIIIDAIHLGRGPAGRMYCFDLNELPGPTSGHLASAHETNLRTALAVGRTMGVHLPERVTVVAIESPCVYDFSENLTLPVAEAVPVAARKVLGLLEG